MGNVKIVWAYMEKFSMGVWGLNIIDMFVITDIEFLSSIDTNLKAILGVLGAVYFAIQIPFKVLDLIEKRKTSKLENRIKEEEIKDTILKRKELKKANDLLEHFDETHELIKENNKKNKRKK